ncbi:1,4-alpha-glucan branching protein GlgB [Aestuariibacter sp. AA17]|uniref:1,4-alpha-glucan branching enzyme GlgB n=1 Tax=Fluctibacter corallii TaxID=2984329 RepID=A0ABT3A6D7_9ALTE|nr:1,4-alpha-glucan branching protein GlgB [Aestuariibacter sp. AA17]MCV2884246.1 1,4-alpha-glucan branching protein GlgB [Aestuariibacter sp. AA17]
MQLYHQFEQAICDSPFDFLGLTPNKNTTRVRSWQPGALTVMLFDLESGRDIAALQRVDKSDLFEASIKTKSLPKRYGFRIENREHVYEVIDPYQFQDEAYHAVHFIDHAPANIYKQLGAQVISLDVGIDAPVNGTRFAVYAPDARAVSVIGDFNFWDATCHPMQKTSLGYWVLFVPGVHAGQRYKYQIKDNSGNVLPHKADPVGFSAEQYPSHASIVYDHHNYEWNDSEWFDTTKGQSPYQRPMSIYEVHLGSWKRPDHPTGRRYLSYIELADDLIDYVKSMSFTHIEILPVSEYPFDGSWGYQPVGLFAPTSRFGDPDAFKYFVDQCHQQGIGVIIDWVPAHFPEDGHGLARFDGSHVYEYADPQKGWHPDWNSCIYDFGKEYVRQFLVANALYWFEHFHVDGIRVDAVASMLYLDYSRKEGEWTPNIDGGNHNYEAISLLQWMNTEVYQAFPYAITIAEESTSFAGVSKPVHHGGLGFGFKWNMGWMHDSLHYMSKDSAYRRYHHNEMTFSMVYSYYENFILPLSHDEVVHGKGALLRKMPGDEWQQAANLRAYLAFMFAHPGKKLNFMGNEIGQTTEWNHDSSVAWDLLQYDKHKGIQELIKRLNDVYRSIPALHELDHDPAGFSWIDHQNAQQSIFSFIRRSTNNVRNVYVISNFTPEPKKGFRLGVEHEGQYEVIVDTDSKHFWGSGFAPEDTTISSDPLGWNQLPYSINLILPPLATLFIVSKG